MLAFTHKIKSLLSGLCFLAATVAYAQRIAPFPYSSTTSVNYVRTWDAKAPTTNANTILVSSSTDSFLMTTQYLDGLGRPIQTVAKGMTPLGKDLVTATTYDEFGREQFKYLPFAANSFGGNTSLSDGGFKINPFQQDSVFSKAQYPGENYFYSQVFFEASPLNRPTETFAPGDSWVGTYAQSSASNRRSVKSEYLINTVSDSVRIWNVTSTFSAAPTTDSIYRAGELFKNVTKDEIGNAVVEYRDKEGKVVLKKVQLAASPGMAHVGWLCTYYVYDDLGQLRFVLQPRAVELINPNWSITNTIRDELCFYYGYDQRGRMTVKKVPGAGEVYMVYDTRDRLAMTQDANLRNTSKWMVTLYDELNRPKITGLLDNTGSYSKTVDQHRGDAGSSSNYPFAYNSLPSSGFDLLTETGYDSYDNLPSGCPNATLDNTYITSTNFFTTYNASPNYAQEILKSSQTKGLVTWTKVKVLGTASDYLYTISLYDEKGRVVQVKSTNISGGADIATTQYDFSGKVLRSHIKHQKSGPNANTYTILAKSTYDHAGRLLTVSKRVNNSTTSITTDKVILKNSYDELGQLKKKVLGSSVDSLEYEYNIRGWMLGMNRAYAKSTSATNHYFGFDLGYDKTSLGTIGSYSQAAYNGNITGTIWKSAGDGEVRKYDFSYDAVNRLTGADFNQYTSSSFNKTADIDFSVNGLTYDANGNILTMNQKGWKVGGSITLDSLLYTYRQTGTSNQLLNVIDRANDTATRVGDFRSSTAYMTALGTKTTANAATYTDYSYDDNGNLKKDRNKDIGTASAEGIFYNHLNLPDSIVVTGKGSIKYLYDAGGTKLKKIVHESGKPDQVTLYLLGTYLNDTLQFLPQEEGRIRPTTSTSDPFFVYDYMLKDHLGNVRMVLTEEGKEDMYPAASMEDVEDVNHLADPTNYVPYYDKTDYTADASCRYLIDNIPNYPEDTYTEPNKYVARLIAENHRIGPGKALKVMAGDMINIRASSWYQTNGTSSDDDINSILDDLLSSMAGGVAKVAKGGISQSQIQPSYIWKGVDRLLENQNGSYEADRPKAFVSWVLFDEQFNYVEESSGFEQVGEDGDFTIHERGHIPMTKNGYLYVFVSNESLNIPVYFDNLQVTHIRGPILEETHYYPFGLTMQGISSKAAGGIQNRYKFGGKELQSSEFSDGSGLEQYDYGARMYDPQIGRWMTIDPKADKYPDWSPYVYVLDNPINLIDADGREPGKPDPPTAKQIRETITTVYKQWAKAVEVTDKTLTAAEGYYRYKAYKARQEIRELTDEMFPDRRDDAGGAGGAGGSWEYAPGVKPPKIKERSDSEKSPLERQRDKLVREEKKYTDIADALGGTREALGYFTIKGLVTGQAEDFVKGIIESVRERYDKASDKDKKDFDVMKETKNVLWEKIQDLVKQANDAMGKDNKEKR